MTSAPRSKATARRRLRVFAPAVLGAIVLAAVAVAAASDGGNGQIDVDALRAAHAKPGSRLDDRLEEVSSASRKGVETVAGRFRAAGLDFEGGRVRIIAAGSSARDAVIAAGGSVEAEVGDAVQALVPSGRLDALAAAPGVTEVRPPARAEPMAISEGVVLSGASELHTAGTTGTGVKVAIIDLGFQGYQALLGTELPTVGNVVTNDLCGGNFTTASGHGTAVAEIVHDVAPGAQLLLACVNSELTLNQAEQWAVAQGARVINHSVGWFNTGAGDGSGGPGSPDAAVADAEAHGVLWVNAAGNEELQHWSGGSDLDHDTLVEFDQGGGTEGNTVTVPPGATVCGDLKWDGWPATTNDFDLYLLRKADGVILTGSANDQSTSPLKPTEELCWTNAESSPVVADFVIQRYASAAWGLSFFSTLPLTFHTRESIIEPASSPSAVAVGAVCFSAPTTVEPYSSTGGFTTEKPDVVSYDSVSTATYGAAASCGSSGFAGTSAAAAHVSGVAALLIQSRPSATVVTLRGALEREGSDVELDGVDILSGWGLAHVTSRNGSRVLAFTGDSDHPFAGLVSGNGTYRTGVGPDPVRSTGPDWSSDGTKLALAFSATDIATLPFQSIASLPPLGSPKLSPDGTVLLSGGGDIVKTPVDGSPAQTVIASAGEDVEPVWSPDGTKFAYASTRDGQSEIYVANADGSLDHRVTNDNGFDGYPAWSPDGTKIAFVSNRAGMPNLWKMNADGTGLVHLTTDPLASDYTPDWSSDDKIAFVRNVAGKNIMVMNVDGTDVYPVASGFRPDWRPGTPMAPVNIVAPHVLDDSPALGVPVGVSLGRWAGAAPMTFSVQWARCATGNTQCVNIPAASGKTYVPTAADVGTSLRATVMATNVGGSTSGATSPVQVVSGARIAPAALPTVTGSAIVGSTLSVVPGSWTPAGSTTGFGAWHLCAPSGGPCVDLPVGGSTYTVTQADVGYRLRLEVAGTNTGTGAAILSLPSAIVTVGSSGGGGSSSGGGGGAGKDPDIELALVADRIRAGVGEQVLLTGRVSLKNFTQASGAGNVRLSVNLPAGLELVSSKVNRGSGCSGTTTIVCPLDFIASTYVAQAELTVRVGSSSPLRVEASVTANERDPDAANNVASLTINDVSTPLTPPTPPKSSPRPLAKKGVTKLGTAKDETLVGTAYADRLEGRAGNDVLRGLAGDDVLVGGLGRDTIEGGGGADSIRARDGKRDVVRCGAGKDAAFVDRFDVATGCETVKRA